MEARGSSMEPYFPAGGERTVCNLKPEIGDSIAFKCNADKCRNKNMHKFLKDQKGDCIWVEGGNDKSFDSRNYGWLCGDEYKILGVTK